MGRRSFFRRRPPPPVRWLEQLLLENPTAIVPGDRVTLLAYDVSQ
jgi:hypothetical protein